MWILIIAAVCFSIICVIGVAWIAYSINRSLAKQQRLPSVELLPQHHIDLKPLQKQLDDMPNKILSSITNSTNTYKGALGELVGYINLRASYDRIIPLGSIVDFVCIRFPDDTHPGCVDFVDVKTGHKARLSKDQRSLQQLIKDKKINFCQLKIETSDADHSRQP